MHLTRFFVKYIIETNHIRITIDEIRIRVISLTANLAPRVQANS